MDEPAEPVTLVGLEFDKPILFPGHVGLGNLTLSGPAPPGIAVAIASSNPNIISVDGPLLGSPGDEVLPVVLSPQALGTAVITVTLGNSIQVVVTVEKDPKEGKEGKELKEDQKRPRSTTKSWR